ncbi:hypothetical protein QT15_19755 [Pseudoalteromonas flavipulchra NCIMB 2033 = ATCC BAA-314]|nr:hypothetical protein QT15_19755 [Pseudoalteromonas flavipulchra NCIMB 2033 = ATCC BAA-314]
MLVGGDSFAEQFMFSNEFVMKKSPYLTGQKSNIKTTRSLCETAPPCSEVMLVGGDSFAEQFMFSNEFLMKKFPHLTGQKSNIKTTRSLCKTAPTR